MTATTKTQGVHHLGLTVQNIHEASQFFIEALGFKKAGEVPDYPAIFVSDGTVLLTLWQVSNSENEVAFDRKNNIGLHHFALHLAPSTDINALYETLTLRDDAVIEFAPQALGQSGLQHMMCLIPSGIRLELLAG